MILGLAVATPLALAGRGLLPVPGRGGEGEPLPRRRRGAPADRLRALRPSRAASGGQRPWFALLFLLPALSLAGVPPLSGFWAKLLLVQATLDAGRYGLAFAVLAVGLAHPLRHGAGLGGGVLGRPSGRRRTRSPAACPSPCWRRSSSSPRSSSIVGVNAGPFIDSRRRVAARDRRPRRLRRRRARRPRDEPAPLALARPGPGRSPSLRDLVVSSIAGGAGGAGARRRPAAPLRDRAARRGAGPTSRSPWSRTTSP